MIAKETEKERRTREGDGAFLAEHSRFVCRSVKAFDIQPPTEKGPDLPFAPDEVRTRFAKTVEESLFDPTGTMKIILESQIVSTDEQKWGLSRRFRKPTTLSRIAPPKAAQNSRACSRSSRTTELED